MARPGPNELVEGWCFPKEFATEDAGVTLLWGLIALGQIRMRKINDYQLMPMLLEKEIAA